MATVTIKPRGAVVAGLSRENPNDAPSFWQTLCNESQESGVPTGSSDTVWTYDDQEPTVLTVRLV